MTKVVFLLVPRLHLLDLAGPAQAFGTADDLGCGYQLCYVAEREEVPTAQGITVRAATDWPALAADDLIVVPGWRSPRIAGTGPLTATTLKRLASHHDEGGTVASVCAGADALGRAGLLNGRRCTTHHDIQDELATRYPLAAVLCDVLYVIDGRVATSAGIASGIDLALHLIAARDGPAMAARVAREMVVYARRNGDEHQASAMLRHRNHLSDLAHRAQDRIEAGFADTLPLPDLAKACGVSERTLTRRFVAATGMTPLRYQQVLRLERAEHLIAVRDGPAMAARVAREMVVYARRNGDEQQASAMLRHRSHLSDLAHRAQDHIEAGFADPLPLPDLARACGVSERTLTRRFVAATGMTPLRYQQILRLERAEHLIGHGATVDAAARAVGFQDARMLRRLRLRTH